MCAFCYCCVLLLVSHARLLTQSFTVLIRSPLCCVVLCCVALRCLVLCCVVLRSPGKPQTRDSYFPPMWHHPVACTQCGAHVGWLFDVPAETPVEETQFYSPPPSEQSQSALKHVEDMEANALAPLNSAYDVVSMLFFMFGRRFTTVLATSQQ
jgi:hypothetical protein